MKKIIHHIRRQPETVKRHILHVTVLIAGVLLFFVWVYSLCQNFNDTAQKSNIKEELAPLSVLKNNLALPQW